ncbi:MerR family transcriptional regulator [Mesobacillus harenae]|uniref:MerR family transcriptional regulator n=1 Tax=Mesobacillus harenae TaxID=2213203 RepID=UPI0030D36397
MKNENVPNEALFPIGVVMEMTGLTARQIRYYEEKGLITPMRSRANRRIYSLNDVKQCIEIRKLLELGFNIAGVEKVLQMKSHNEL